MKREIKFRGHKCQGGGKWIYGNCLMQNKAGTCYISDDTAPSKTKDKNYSEVIHVGQFTGLKDKNGKDIYEGDILRTDLERDYLIVVFRNGAFMFDCFDEKHYYDFMTYAEDDSGIINLSIIGNIYDNSELLK